MYLLCNDIKCGGFDGYASEFIRLHVALVNAKSVPTSLETTEWVMAGISNFLVKSYMASNFLTDGKGPNYDQCFKTVREYLKHLGDFDPYKTSMSSPLSKPIVAAVVSHSVMVNFISRR